jgi:hypothetical protein
MNLDSIEQVARLRDQREHALTLMRAISEGSLSNLDFFLDGKAYHLPAYLNEQFLRAAISYAAEKELVAVEAELRSLGVRLPDREEPAPTVDSAMSELKMYQKAWIRELGGSLRVKRHLIDALVVTTQEIREKASRYRKDVVSKDVHDRRVTELLEHNNKMEERMRTAERKLRAFMNGTPAEQLAFAVEQAAAVTIASIRTNTHLPE